mmetsp:Transcript_7745/g.13814  ORF Transcript_7745/g.13814 Transcript_7745/m.13814 type:complete len:117 (+) Transcript_7745:1059-1409(+)
MVSTSLATLFEQTQVHLNKCKCFGKKVRKKELTRSLTHSLTQALAAPAAPTDQVGSAASGQLRLAWSLKGSLARVSVGEGASSGSCRGCCRSQGILRRSWWSSRTCVLLTELTIDN